MLRCIGLAAITGHKKEADHSLQLSAHQKIGSFFAQTAVYGASQSWRLPGGLPNTPPRHGRSVSLLRDTLVLHAHLLLAASVF